MAKIYSIAVVENQILTSQITGILPTHKITAISKSELNDFTGDIAVLSQSDLPHDYSAEQVSELLICVESYEKAAAIALSSFEIFIEGFSSEELKFRLNRVLNSIQCKQALKDEKEILRRIEEAGKMGYFVNDFHDQENNYMSDAGFTMMGCEPQSHVPSGESFETYLHPDDLPKLLECRTEMQEKGFADKEFRVRRQDTNEYIWMLARTTFFKFDKEGNPTHTIGIHQDITRIKEQELKIQALLKEDLMENQQKLGMATLQNINKNDLLTEIRKRLEGLSSIAENEVAVKGLLRFIDKSIQTDDQWDHFEKHFEHVHSGFFTKLSDRYPKLTINEKKLCAFYRLNLSTKEIASMLNIEVSSAKRGRNRLRKKLELPATENLTNFLEAM